MIIDKEPTADFELSVKEQPRGFDSDILEEIFTKYKQALTCNFGTSHVIKTFLRESEAQFLVQLLSVCGVSGYARMVVDKEATNDRLMADAGTVHSAAASYTASTFSATNDTLLNKEVGLGGDVTAQVADGTIKTVIGDIASTTAYTATTPSVAHEEL